MRAPPAPRLRAWLVGLALLLALPGAATAEPAKLTPAEVEALVDKAQTLIATRNIVQALAIYEQIYDATGATKHLYNIGYLHEDMGQLDVAWDYYQRFLMAWPDAPNAGELRTYLDELAQELGKTHVLVHVFTTPPGASLEILTTGDARRPFGVTPISTWMPVGKVLVRLRLDGHEMLDKKITVKRRKSQRLKLTLVPVVEPGLLTCGNMAPGSALTVDGKPRPDAASGVQLSLAPGEHTLVLTLADGTELKASVTVADGTVSALPEGWWSPPAPSAEPVAAPSSDTGADLSAVASGTEAGLHIPLGAWVTGGVAVASLVSGAVVMVMAHGKAGEAKDSADLLAAHNAAGRQEQADQQYAVWKPQHDDAETLQTTSIILFALGAAAAAGSVVWWLLDEPSDAASDAAIVTPIILDDGLGAAASWRF